MVDHVKMKIYIRLTTPLKPQDKAIYAKMFKSRPSLSLSLVHTCTHPHLHAHTPAPTHTRTHMQTCAPTHTQSKAKFDPELATAALEWMDEVLEEEEPLLPEGGLENQFQVKDILKDGQALCRCVRVRMHV